MLIATLPTLRGDHSLKLAEEIIKHPLIGAVRYNTGGDSPYTPKQILESIKPITERYGKAFYVDLEGRQVRVARWSPHSRGSVTLNRDFEITLPARIHFRRAGWFEVVNADLKERKIFFSSRKTRQEYYFGETQSVHVIAKEFKVKEYLGGFDFEYIKAAAELGINKFMLSFVECLRDIDEFLSDCCEGLASEPKEFELVLKIESIKGVEFVRNFPPKMLTGFQFMAARDDLFLGFVDRRHEFLDALKLIVEKDPNAIVASRIMSGLESYGEITLGDMTDVVLMHRFGYRNFMLSDELSDNFESAIKEWRSVITPLLEQADD